MEMGEFAVYKRFKISTFITLPIFIAPSLYPFISPSLHPFIYPPHLLTTHPPVHSSILDKFYTLCMQIWNKGNLSVQCEACTTKGIGVGAMEGEQKKD